MMGSKGLGQSINKSKHFRLLDNFMKWFIKKVWFKTNNMSLCCFFSDLPLFPPSVWMGVAADLVGCMFSLYVQH